ncbi:hypothetical protein [Melittangium boletus]|uniref:Uncharacterized protein n=1 Tax=Melittangium boletus DSM 14713 TaxID=1294270 RepID=A0A250ITP4_9BACT|nr:hypothetical protein [Melittangium boletus]ATB34557.1 hypothetical protein MEBOL_008062 [Melittangium boletus DSM 14713]
MRSVLVAAMMARMAAAGGAGAGVEAEAQYVRAGDTWEDVRKHFSALRNEVSTLEAQYQEAMERRRLEALRRQEESEFARRGR